MNSSLNLKELMVDAENVDNQEFIRERKHADLLKKDVLLFESLKRSQSTSEEMFRQLCQEQCLFLFNNYFDIFNKLIKDQLNIQLLKKFIVVLKLIEDNVLSQHDASVKIGTILKEMFIDSQLRLSEQLDAQYGTDEPAETVDPIPISWKQYKNSHPNS
jgi:hypothetical protein